MDFDLGYAKNVIETEAAAVAAVSAIVDANFATACDMMYNCRGAVIVSGMGKAGIVGQKISATLASTGTPSHFIHPAEAVHGDLGRIRSDDIVLALSHGGETEEIVRMINLVKGLGVKMISLTADGGSTLGKYSEVVLAIGKQVEICPLKAAPSVSTTVMLAVGDALALTVMKARNFGVEDYVRFHPGGSLGRNLMTVEQSMMFRPGEKLPVASIGDTVRQMLDKTKDVKRHGAVMIADARGCLVGILTDADIRRLMARDGEGVFALKVADIMTREPKCIRIDALAAEATGLFHKYRIDELPVVDANGCPVGMIDVQDIITIKVVG